MKTSLVPVVSAEGLIHLIRGARVIIDHDLAALYGVSTRILNQQVRRNRARFPGDFLLSLTPDEEVCLRSQIVISKKGRGGRRYPTLAFTEQGVAMLSTVLNSERAIRVNIEIMRAFCPRTLEDERFRVSADAETRCSGGWKGWRSDTTPTSRSSSTPSASS